MNYSRSINQLLTFFNSLHELNNLKLDHYLCYFYVEARTKDGALYPRLGWEMPLNGFLTTSSTSFTKYPAVFQIPAESNKTFVFQLSCRKRTGFHRQQFRRFSQNFSIQILFLPCFLRTETNTEGLVFPQIRILCDFATFQLFDVLTAFYAFLQAFNRVYYSTFIH